MKRMTLDDVSVIVTEWPAAALTVSELAPCRIGYQRAWLYSAGYFGVPGDLRPELWEIPLHCPVCKTEWEQLREGDATKQATILPCPCIVYGTDWATYYGKRPRLAQPCDCGGAKANTTHSTWCSSRLHEEE